MDLRGNLNNLMRIENFINISNIASTPPPDHLPEEIKAVYEEGATCMAVNCHKQLEQCFAFA